MNDILLFAAALSHYTQDSWQPLHATDNYDGAQTQQWGIHARFEADLFERFRSRLVISPPPVSPIASPRDAAFDTLLASHQLVGDLLAADKRAIGSKTTYDDAYYEAFFTNARSILEQRLGGAISASASMIVGAWQAAGKPVLKTEIPRAVQNVRRP